MTFIEKPPSDLNPVRTVVFYTYSGEDALTVLRLLGPARQLGWRVLRGVVDGRIEVDTARQGDVIVIQRDFCRDLAAYEKILAVAQAEKKPLIFDLDDWLLELPEYHPDRLSRYFAEALLPMLQAILQADLLTVSTPTLRDVLLPYNPRIAVLPNYLNDALWELRPPAAPVSKDGKVVIGYMGGHSHLPDLEMVMPVLLRLAEKYPEHIRYQFWGLEPPPELAPFSQVDWCPPASYRYADFAAYFQTQTAQIALAPLCDSRFNRCKSAIKYLEYSAVGFPGVYSRIAPYQQVIEDGVDGFLAGSSQEWEARLSQLIEDPTLRTRLALQAQAKLRAHWMLSDHAAYQGNVYAQAVSEYSVGRPKPPFLDVVKSLAHQYVEEQNYKNNQIIEAQNRIAELEAQLMERGQAVEHLSQELAEREEEVLSYALSYSWRMTRPLRKIARAIK